MSIQERWVVYPLLFMAIALGLRDKVIEPESKFVPELRCHELTITNQKDQPIFRAGSTLEDRGSLVIFYSGDVIGDTLADLDDTNGQRRAVEMGEDEVGGFIKVFGPRDMPALKLSHMGSLELSGLVAVDEGDQPLRLGGADESPIWGEVLPWEFVRPAAEVTDGDAPAENTDSTAPDGSDSPPTTVQESSVPESE